MCKKESDSERGGGNGKDESKGKGKDEGDGDRGNKEEDERKKQNAYEKANNVDNKYFIQIHAHQSCNDNVHTIQYGYFHLKNRVRESFN